jgi:hypothetical protein
MKILFLCQLMSSLLLTRRSWSPFGYVNAGNLRGASLTSREREVLALVTVADRQHHVRPVTEADVQPGSTPQPIGKPIPLELSPAARAAGVIFLYRGAKVSYMNRPLHEYLRRLKECT